MYVSEPSLSNTIFALLALAYWHYYQVLNLWARYDIKLNRYDMVFPYIMIIM
jgi:hypothetical protein